MLEVCLEPGVSSAALTGASDELRTPSALLKISSYFLLNISVARLFLLPNLCPVEACHSKIHGMKPEKPKKAKAPEKRTRTSAKNEAPAEHRATSQAAPLKSAKAVVAKLKATVAPAQTAAPAKSAPASAPEPGAPLVVGDSARLKLARRMPMVQIGVPQQ